jgi:plasmid stabilization system protein ParE
MTPRFTAHARDDLRAILSYIERQSPQGATNVARAMRKTAELIGQFPEAGRLAGEQRTRVLPVGRYPYLVYWGVENGEP